MNRIRTDVFKGLHKRDGAPEGSFLEVSGITTADYPTMKVREPRSRVGEWENATDVYETDGHMVVVDDNKLYYDGEFKSNVGSGKKQFAEINRNLVIWPDKIIINLNTGETRKMEEAVSGTAVIDKRGKISFTGEESNSTGSITVKGAYWSYYDEETGLRTYMELYDDLYYADGKWNYSRRSRGLPADGGRDMKEGESKELDGPWFIGSSPKTTSLVNSNEWYTEGTVYGKLTRITCVDRFESYTSSAWEHFLDRYEYTVKYEFDLYDVSGLDLTRFFEAEDSVALEGSKIAYNNRKGLEVTEVTKNALLFPENTLISSAKYYDVTEDLEPGVYGFYYGEGNTGNKLGWKVKTEKTIRAGSQVFGETATSGTGKPVYSYEKENEILVELTLAGNADVVIKEFTMSDYDGSEREVLTISRKLPDMDYICERDNRLFGVSNAEESMVYNPQTGSHEKVKSRVLHASALGSATKWESYQGTNADSYAVAVAGEGDFTGIISYSGNVIAFKEDKMYKLSGDYPAEFFLRSYNIDGVKEGCHKTMVIINEVLYFLSPYGVMSYSGGVPGLISYELGLEQYGESVAGRDGTNYMIQMDKLYCYDTIHGLWVSEDYGEVTAIEPVNNRAYIVTDGKIMMTDSGNEEVAWYATTHYMDEGTFLHKDYQAMNLDAALSEGAEITIEYRTDEDEDWKTLETVTSYHGTQWQTRTKLNESKRKHWKFTPGIMRCDRIQFRLRGKGQSKIYAYDRVVRAESDRA